ncbi:CoA transferase, partial [Candidatus Bathyarchaeota archaeon]|nr:CoA transferase [Candidatus Bathyarchaeota archaeon]
GASQHFKTKDMWVYVDASTDKSWQGFCDAFNIGDEGRREFATEAEREKDPDKVGKMMANVISGLRAIEVLEKLVKVGVPCAQVNTFKDVLDDPHLLATKSLVLLPTDPEVTGRWYRRDSVAVMMPIRSSFYNPGIEGWGGKAMPKQGENTVEVLRGLGYSEEQITELRKSKIAYP